MAKTAAAVLCALLCQLIHALPLDSTPRVVPERIPPNTPPENDVDNPLSDINVVFQQNPVVESNHEAVIEVSPKVLTGSPQLFDVSWTMREPHEDDLLAVYVTGERDLMEVHPVQYTKASQSATHLTAGTGSLKMSIVNHRADFRIAYLASIGDRSHYVAAVSDVVRVQNPEQPLRIHVALTDKKGEMSVQWSTKSRGNPVVRWGVRSGEYEHQAPAESVTYTREELCGHPAKGRGYINPGMLHKAAMTDLEPGRTYYYIVGDEVFGFSDEISFKAPGEAGPEKSLKMAMVADMGQSMEPPASDPHDCPNSLLTSSRINQEKELDLILHIGDVSYAQGYAGDWDRFFDQWGEAVTKVPYMTSPGNHERDWPYTGDRYDNSYNSGGECGVAYERHLKMPQPGPDKPWYSFEMGPVHFLTFSGEHDFLPGSEQYQFMDEDLSAVDRSATPWVVVAGHRPMYLSITPYHRRGGYYTVSIELQQHMEPLLMKHKVDMMWGGHHHSYHRTCPVYKQKCVGVTENSGTALAPVHFVFGTAGRHLYGGLVESPFEKVGFSKFGYMRAEATGSTFKLEMVDNTDGSLMDSHTLVKPPGWESDWEDFWTSGQEHTISV
ncbi:hypothetical protein BSKO_13590 [Bryopsis sp. KO-2023]|nr:hypothetical protein BSKO_13590 [Bryopsis sp. KO-2023]